MSPIQFRRKPYTVTYKDFHTGEEVKIKRRPPAKLHHMLPTDIVEIKNKKNEIWDEGEEVAIKHISYRAPNTLQLINEDNETTFVAHHDVNLVEEVAYRGTKEENEERENTYLRWP